MAATAATADAVCPRSRYFGLSSLQTNSLDGAQLHEAPVAIKLVSSLLLAKF
jgi:hypothetical protein